MDKQKNIVIVVCRVIVILILLSSWIFKPNLRVILGVIGAALLVILSYIFHKELLEKEEMQDSIKALKNAYDELDEQAKLMARTDLELNKTQEELDKKITGLYTLHEWGNKASQTFSESELFDSITEEFVSKLGFKRAIIITLNEKLKKLQLRKAVNYSQGEIQKLENEVNKRKLFAKLLSKGNPLLITKVNEDKKVQKQLNQITKLNSFVLSPILKQDTSIGIVIMGHKSPYNQVTEGDLELVSILGSQIGISLQNSDLYKQLWQSHQDLEKRVKQRTKELAEANEELKRLNKIKSRFVSSVTHELRTPLTSIKGFSSILIDGKLGEVPPAQLKRLKKIRKHSANLSRLINNLLDISRIESGRVEMQKKEIPLNSVFKNVMEIIKPQAEDKNIEVKKQFHPEDIKINADPNYLERIFVNLLGNAVKFTPEEGKVEVTSSYKNTSVKIAVSDNGPGIPEEDQSNIFEEFYRAENKNQVQKGSGLGLSLVKRIVDAHNGKIWLDSKVGEGTTFTFTLPNKDASENNLESMEEGKKK